MFQFLLHMNLAFLFMEMQELAEAEQQLLEADALLPLLTKRTRAGWHDHYLTITLPGPLDIKGYQVLTLDVYVPETSL